MIDFRGKIKVNAPVAGQNKKLVPVTGFLSPGCSTIEFSIRVTFCYFFVCMENESKCKWRTLKIIDTNFFNVIANLF